MRCYRRRLATNVILVRCLVLSFAGQSAVVAPTNVASIPASSPSPSDEIRTPPAGQLSADKTVRFPRRPLPLPSSPSSVETAASTPARRGTRRPISGLRRLRHRGDVVTFRRKSHPLGDVIGPWDRYADPVVSAGNHFNDVSEDVWSRVERDLVDYKVSKQHRTPAAISVAVTDDDDDDGDVEANDDAAAATARRRLPGVIIIGAKKSGTRALLEFLKIHPDVRAAGPETHFFDRFYDRGLDWYRSRMPATTSGQLTVEKTPSYLVSGRVVERILAMDPDVRLLVVVRDPVTRAVSDYTQAATKRPDIAPFEQLAFLSPGNLTKPHHECWMSNESAAGACQVNTSWGAIRIGLYVRHVSRWLRLFPLSQIHVVHGERLVTDPAGQMRLVERFLGLRPVISESNFELDPVKGFPCIVRRSSSSSSGGGEGAPPRSAVQCLGKTKGRVHRKVAEAALRRLRQFFRPLNEQFYRLVGVDFGWS